MHLAEIEHEIARLDAIYRPVLTEPVDVAVLEPDASETMAASVGADLTRLAVDDHAEAILRAVIGLYIGSDETVRAAIRRLFDRYTAFRWAARLPPEMVSPEAVRIHLVHLSARDQASDTRDEILILQDVCDRARRAGIDVDPVLDEVAAMSSAEDRYGMGSMRTVLLEYGRRRTG